MPRELITIQVGQCGNQIGREFWRIALEEHATHNPAGVFDEAMSSFFRNVDTRYGSMPLELPVGDGTTPIGSLRARAVLVDMEDGPMSETLRGPLGELFEESQVIREQTSSGSGNNWAQGYYGYGPQHAAGVVEAVRRSAELCDALQSFFLLHSLGGGTGSGLGTYVLGLLEDSFPEVYRFAASVFPGAGEEDVVTGPYNAALACAELSARADCVLPVDNGALAAAAAAAAAAGSRGGREGGGEGDGGFGGMNAVAAQMLAHLTSSVRFSGELNVDLNEITTNLVPFPRLQYILAGYSPLGSMSRGDTRMAPRNLKQMFADIISPSHQLMDVNPKGGTVLACAMLLRGDVAISDVTSNIDKLQSQLQMVHWNREGFKVGLCSTPPVHQKKSILCLSNNSCISTRFELLKKRFDKLFARRAMVHHYVKLADEGVFHDAAENLQQIIQDYQSLSDSVSSTIEDGGSELDHRLVPVC